MPVPFMPATFRLAREIGRFDEPCLVSPDAPGLCVHEYAAHWNVSKVDAGLAMFQRIPSQALAEQAAREFAALADWSRPYATITADAVLIAKARDLRAELERRFGMTLTTNVIHRTRSR